MESSLLSRGDTQSLLILTTPPHLTYLEASNPQYFGMYVQMIGNNDHPNFYTTLTKDTSSQQVDHSMDLKTIASAGYPPEVLVSLKKLDLVGSAI